MARVLQLLPHESDFQTRRSVEILTRELGRGFVTETHTIGPAGTYRSPALAALNLPRSTDEFDLIHAWGLPALSAAAIRSTKPILYSPTGVFHPRSARWLRAIMSYRNAQAICPSATWRKLLIERGVDPARCHLIRPGVDFARVRRRRDPQLRAALGFQNGDHIILAPGESDRHADHELALWAVSILHVLNPRQKILLWGRGNRTSALARLAAKLNQNNILTLAEQTLRRKLDFDELIGAADIVLVTARETSPTLPILICMAAGLPIVSTVNYTTGELLEDRHTALMVPHRSARQLAQRILDVQKDPQLQWSISDMARTEAFSYFAMTRFVNQWREIYRQTAEGKKVEVLEEAPTAGLRFHCRA